MQCGGLASCLSAASGLADVLVGRMEVEAKETGSYNWAKQGRRREIQTLCRHVGGLSPSLSTETNLRRSNVKSTDY